MPWLNSQIQDAVNILTVPQGAVAHWLTSLAWTVGSLRAAPSARLYRPRQQLSVFCTYRNLISLSFNKIKINYICTQINLVGTFFPYWFAILSVFITCNQFFNQTSCDILMNALNESKSILLNYKEDVVLS